jgi:hypothetical protein
MALGLFLALLGPGEGMAAKLPPLPFKVIVNQVGDLDGFGFGLDVVPIGKELPGPPSGPGDPDPFDAPDEPCALTVSWTHDFTADLPQGAEILFALLVVNAAGIQPELFPSTLFADSTTFPLFRFDQGELGSGLVVVPLDPADLADGLLNVKIVKGRKTRTGTLCDQQFYDTSVLLLLVRMP